MPSSELKEFLDFVDERKKKIITKHQKDTEMYEKSVHIMEKYEESKDFLSKEDLKTLLSVIRYFNEFGKNSKIVDYLHDFIVEYTPAYVIEDAYPMTEEEYEIVVEASKIIGQYNDRSVNDISANKLAILVKRFADDNTSPRITGVAKEEYEIMLENQSNENNQQ